jgi:hypothetical protein
MITSNRVFFTQKTIIEGRRHTHVRQRGSTHQSDRSVIRSAMSKTSTTGWRSVTVPVKDGNGLGACMIRAWTSPGGGSKKPIHSALPYYGSGAQPNEAVLMGFRSRVTGMLIARGPQRSSMGPQPPASSPAPRVPDSQWPEFDWRRPSPSFPGTYSYTATSIAVLPADPRHPQRRRRVAPVQITRPIQILQVNWDRERLDRQVAHTVLYVHGIPWQKQTPVTFLFLTGGEQDDGAVTRWLPEFRFVPTSRCPCHDNWLTWTSRRPESIIGSIMSWVLGSTCPYLNVCVISFPIVDPRAEWISVFN